MSRQAFERWGWELTDREFGRALATLGVLARELAEAGQAEPALSSLPEIAARAGARPLLWDLAPLGSPPQHRALLERLPAQVLAQAWAALPPPAEDEPWRDLPVHPRSLEVRSQPWLEDSWVFEMLSWATDESTPHFALDEPAGRLRWHWPLRVGFAADQGWLKAQLYESLSRPMAALTEPEVGPTRCDLLLVWRSVHDPWPPPVGLPEATFVVSLAEPANAPPISAGAQLAGAAQAWGAAMVQLKGSRSAEWLRTFLRGLSHESALLSSLRLAGGIAAVYAAPRLLEQPPLRLAGELLAGRLEHVAETIGPEPVAPELPERTRMALGVDEARRPRMAELGARLRETDLAFAHETDGATDVAEVARAAEPVLRTLERQLAESRFIRAGVAVIGEGDGEGVQVRAGFEAGALHRVLVSIGPRDKELIVADTPIDPGLLADAAGHRLTVVFSAPTLLDKPLVRRLMLPPFGATKAAAFELRVKPATARVEARISVLHRGRILQTALLRGPVLSATDLRALAGQPAAKAAIEIVAEANLRPNFVALDDRRRFHAALVLNHDAAGEQGGTAIARDSAVSFKLDWVRDSVNAVSRVLDRAERDRAFGRKLDSKTSVRYLRLLALNGVTLYDNVGRRMEEALGGGGLERIQILSANPNTMLPVEVIYDLPPPAAAATLCANWTAALQTGACDPLTFHAEDEEGALDVVCPAGFWGISKIIEREAVDPSALGADVEVRSVPDRQRSTLRPLAPVLLAVSDHVNNVSPTEVDRLLSALEGLTDNRLTHVRTWLDWVRRLRDDDPSVLVLLSHTELNGPDGVGLEIAAKGGPELRALPSITARHVNPNGTDPGPVVMLLGCTTAVPLESFQSFVVKFKDKGAALVVGTIAPVLGRHASRTAETLIDEFRRVAQDPSAPENGVPVGDALREVRRNMLAKGILMAMSLAVYGDADWRLGREA